MIVMPNHKYHIQSDKDIVTKKPARLEIVATAADDGDVAVATSTNEDFVCWCVAEAAAKANTGKLCNCPNSEPGKINLDINAHEASCHIRKRLHSGRYITNTSVTPRRISDGSSLGVAIGGEDF